MNTFRRESSPSERLYIAGERLSPPFTIQVFVEGHGRLDIQRLRAAVTAVGQVCPGSRLVARDVEWVDSGEAPPVREVDGALFDGNRFDRAPFLRERLDPFHGPTCEVVVLQRDPTTVVFRAFHGVMDGRGVLFWAKHVFRALRREELERETSTLTDVGLLRAHGFGDSQQGLKLDSPSPFGQAVVNDKGFLWKRRTLKGDHPGLVAKLASIVAKGAESDRLRFIVPVDLRRHDSQLFSTGNLSLPLFLDVSKGEPWDALHERLLTALAESPERVLHGAEGPEMPLWCLTAILNFYVMLRRWKGNYISSGILSNLGRVELGAFEVEGFAPTTVYSLPVHVTLSPLALVAVECPHHVELTLSCPDGDGMEERAERILDSIEETLVGTGVRTFIGDRQDTPFPLVLQAPRFPLEPSRLLAP